MKDQDHKSEGERALNRDGPVFIVGMPRSGTKLLRSLVSQHSKVAIAEYETEFYPYWVKNWSMFGDLSDKEIFEKFYQDTIRLPYFKYAEADHKLIDQSRWMAFCKDYTPSGVFEALIRLDVGADRGSGIIWGDKSPSYILYLELLKKDFPQARVIHIVRDVRDYSISVNNAWGKNIFRAAQRWVDGVNAARTASKHFIDDYLEVKYEDLLDDPEKTLRHICEFLKIGFEPGMLTLSRAPEQVGDARGSTEVVRSNKNKYEEKLSKKAIEKIENISGKTLNESGYSVRNSSGNQRLSKPLMAYYQLLDGMNLLVKTVKRNGVAGALRYIYGALIVKYR